MPTPGRNDQVFQLSLTEIAFTVSFILLLLLGYLVFKEQSARKDAQAALETAGGTERLRDGLEKAKADLVKALERSGRTDAQKLVEKLSEAEGLRQENSQLQRQVEDLDSKLTAMVEQQKLAGSGSEEQRKAAKDAVLAALALLAAADKAMRDSQGSADSQGQAAASAEERYAAINQAVKLGQAVAAQTREQLGKTAATPAEVAALVADAKRQREPAGDGRVSVDGLRKENSDLKGQLAYMNKRLEARGGRDYPPCWADESGKIEFLFTVETKPEGVSIAPAWPQRRAADARNLPGLDLAISKVHPLSELSTAVGPILQWSRKQDPECRHYVFLKSSIPDAVSSDRARLQVEGFFYKDEIRR